MIKMGRRVGCRCLPWLLAYVGLYAQNLPKFSEHVVTKELKFGYQLVSADLNGDGKNDLLAIDERARELAWFENPGWERHVLAVNVPRQLNADCWDMDGDGIPEIALAYGFETNPEKSAGNLVLLKSGADVRQPWTQGALTGAGQYWTMEALPPPTARSMISPATASRTSFALEHPRAT